jgi:hypothetical protein
MGTSWTAHLPKGRAIGQATETSYYHVTFFRKIVSMVKIPLIFSALSLAATLALTTPASAQASKDFDTCIAAGQDFGTCMTYMMDRNAAGCSAARKQIRRSKKDAAKDGWHLAFAGRKDSTITGIRGCGYAWRRDLAKAQAAAMNNCKKWEVKYGTDNGKKTCRLMN